jgi:MHS family citrate/tricarballylate:H+ symporter-like MFS transporter
MNTQTTASHPAPAPAATKAARAPSKLGAVIRVTSGNFIEMYDFFLFGFYATRSPTPSSRPAANTRR